MIEYHIFWILYAVFTLGGWSANNAHDCDVIAKNLHVETKYEGATCYAKQGDEWRIVK